MAKQKARQRTSSTTAKVAKTYKLYINGKFPRTESGRYFKLERKGKVIANLCQGSRKDFREAVVAARQAYKTWCNTTGYLRGQILYRIAEMLEGRRDQFIEELQTMGLTKTRARAEVADTVDCLVHYAGWSDKYQQVFSTVNPVASSHFNFSVPEAMGVVAVIAPKNSALLGLVANLAPAIVGGNAVVILGSEDLPLCSISLAEVLHSSDVPPGVVNILTGYREELLEHFASHMDVNAVVYCGGAQRHLTEIQKRAADNLKRVVTRTKLLSEGPFTIKDTQEIKTTWHPIGG